MDTTYSNISELSSSFKRLMGIREKVLSKAILETYLDSHLDKRDVFMESASRYGTPQYLFDEPSLRVRIAASKDVFAKYFERYRLFYAMKSNPFEGLCRQAVGNGMGLDVSSGFELVKALKTGCSEIIFSGPGKTQEELRLAFQNRSRVTPLMDSFGEFQRISELLKEKGNVKDPLKLGVRVRSHHLGIWNKFGIPLKDLSEMIKKAVSLKRAQFKGIQFHTSWNLDPVAQITMIKEIGSYLVSQVPKPFHRFLKFLDIGGGFWPEQGEWLNPQHTIKGKLIEMLDPGHRFRLRHYHKKGTILDHFAKDIALAISNQPSPLCHLEIWAEPGRWISTPAMHILLEVVDKKDPRTVITDGGINLLGWERPLTEFIPVINLTRPSRKEDSLRIFGSLCTPHDVWGTSIFGDGIEVGDILLIPDQGAYTYSLRQSFIKPKAKVVRFDGGSLEIAEEEESVSFQ